VAQPLAPLVSFQSQQIRPCAFLRNPDVTLYGFVADHIRMRISGLTARHCRQLCMRSVECGVIGKQNIGTRLGDDIAISHRGIDIGLKVRCGQLEIERRATPGGDKVWASAVLHRNEQRYRSRRLARRKIYRKRCVSQRELVAIRHHHVARSSPRFGRHGPAQIPWRRGMATARSAHGGVGPGASTMECSRSCRATRRLSQALLNSVRARPGINATPNAEKAYAAVHNQRSIDSVIYGRALIGNVQERATPSLNGWSVQVNPVGRVEPVDVRGNHQRDVQCTRNGP
jgi:hypothetical protein